MLFAQITDTHINTYVDSPFQRCSSKQLLGVIEYINHLKNSPLFVLLTGDCVHEGNLDEYLKLKPLLDNFKMPYFMIPGNHDHRENLKTIFPEVGALSEDNHFIHYAIEHYPLRLIALDTVSFGNTYGELCSERLIWLDNTLQKAPNKPTLLFMHHPPAIYGMEILDDIANRATEPFAALLEKHPQVQTILCGHYHRACQTLWQNKSVIIAGSTVAQFSVDMADKEQPYIKRSDEPPAFALHHWKESRLITHFCSLPRVL